MRTYIPRPRLGMNTHLLWCAPTSVFIAQLPYLYLFLFLYLYAHEHLNPIERIGDSLSHVVHTSCASYFCALRSECKAGV